MEVVLKLDSLRYKNILNGITFTLKENSFNVLVGMNGSGKTTLVKAIAGLIDCEGYINMFDQVVTKDNLNSLIKDVGICLSNPTLLEGTVIYNITYSLHNLGYNEEAAKRKTYEISKKLKIDHLLTKDISEISLSERKIVSFASSIIHQPKLIIIDNSFDGLDSNYRDRLIKYLKKLNKSTILFITNNENDLLLADNIIFLQDGKIEFFGELKEILKNEKIFIKNNIKIPFLIELSNKLNTYGLINDVILETEEMVNTIWK